jgi:NAD kinase
LAIVVGGDGNMLGAARVLSRFDVAVIGVNRGNLGFLTDLSPQDYLLPLEQVLSGHYKSEHRFLLEAAVYRHGERKSSNLAVNEAVLHPGKIAHMIEFEVYIDGSFMYSQRSDGIIVATPTGSTAYNFSANGPILPLNAPLIALTPISAFRPRHWRGALLPDSTSITITVLEPEKRPVAAVADHFETRNALEVSVAMDRSINLVMLHDPGHSLDERILREQFGH